MIWILPHTPVPPPSVSLTGDIHAERLRKRAITGAGGEVGDGAKSCDSKKAWSYINNSTFSVSFRPVLVESTYARVKKYVTFT
jgi:hypothetical protein